MIKKNNPTLRTWDALIITDRLQQLRNPRCKSAPTVSERSKRVRKVSLPNEFISKSKLRAHLTVQVLLRIRRKGVRQKGQYQEVPHCFQKSESFYNPEPNIHLIVYFGRCIFKTNQRCPLSSKQNSILLTYKQQYSIRHRLGVYVGYCTHTLHRKLGKSRVVSINFPTGVRQAQLAPTSYSSAVENSCFSKTDYCTVEPASAAKLTQYSLGSLIKERQVMFHMTRRDTESKTKEY